MKLNESKIICSVQGGKTPRTKMMEFNAAQLCGSRLGVGSSCTVVFTLVFKKGLTLII